MRLAAGRVGRGDFDCPAAVGRGILGSPPVEDRLASSSRRFLEGTSLQISPIFSRDDGNVDATITFPPQDAPVIEFGPAEVRVGGKLMAASLVRQVTPVYPQAAIDNRIQGVVVLEVGIATDGTCPIQE